MSNNNNKYRVVIPETDFLEQVMELLGKRRVFDARSRAFIYRTTTTVGVDRKLLGGRLIIKVEFNGKEL